MKLNNGKLPLKDMTHKQLREWLLPIVEHTLFVCRGRILELLTIRLQSCVRYFLTLTELKVGLFSILEGTRLASSQLSTMTSR